MKYREVIRQIVILAFEKARRESLQVLKTPLSKHISARIENEYKVYISEKTFIRYYDKFIGGRDKATGNPNRRILDFLCMYIGFDSFIDFYHRNKKQGNDYAQENSLNLSSYTALDPSGIWNYFKKKSKITTKTPFIYFVNAYNQKKIRKKESLQYYEGFLTKVFV